MLELKYIGPKPIISHTGVEFDNNKKDKYVYLSIAVELVKALNHDYFEDKIYTYEASNKTLDAKELFDEVKKICPDIEELMKKQKETIEQEIEHDLKRAQENTVLDEASKEVLHNNISIMRDYLIQRSINKCVYYCVVYALADILKKDKINHIVVPLVQHYAHVLHSVQGSLRRQKRPIDSSIDIFKDEKGIFVKLKVLNLK